MMNTALSDLHRSRLQLEFAHDQAHSQYKALHTQVSQHQARLSWQPEVRNVLEKLQQREHERQVGAYEKLLSALLRDILPGERDVVLDLYTHAGVPALDIFQRKGLGSPLEDILTGAGGSIANILSAGLRIIALVRSGKRRFLVLDEADCWVKPVWAPNFASVIQQMAVQLGVQVLMISHHDDSLFPALSHKLMLQQDAGGLSTHWSPESTNPVWADDQPGIRSILLEDFQAHSMTFLPLSPGLTLLSGDNDIGKSAVVSALRAVFHNEANDAVVRHHQRSARVTLDMGPDHVLRWERFAKGKVKESFRHYEVEKGPQDPIHASDGARTPDWLDPTFGIGMIDGLDVQLRGQKDVVFLLNDPNTKRARALAIGEEAGHVQSMIAIDKRENQDARRAIADGEAQLEHLSRVVQALSPISSSKDRWAELETLAQRIHERQEEQASRRALLNQWRLAQDQVLALAPLLEQELPALPRLKSNPAHAQLAHSWKESLERREALTALAMAPPIGALPAPKAPALKILLDTWVQERHTVESLAPLMSHTLPTLPERRETQGMRRLLKEWKRAEAYAKALQPLHDRPLALTQPTLQANALRVLQERWLKDHQELQRIEQQIQSVDSQLEALGEVACPTCGRALAEA